MSLPESNPGPRDKTFDMDDATRAWESSYVPPRVQNYLFLVLYGLLLWGYPTTSRILGLSSNEFLPVLARVALLFLGLLPLCAVTFSASVSVFWAYFGFPYQEHRLTYTRAGGHDLMRFLPLVIQGGFLGLYWWTARMDPDPIPGIRGTGSLIGFSVLAGLVLSPLLSLFLFSLYARHHQPEIRRRKEQWLNQRR